MYSFAPAWMAATAARESLLVPQATIGTAMRSASRRSTRSRISSATSTMSRSAQPRERLVCGLRMCDARALLHRELGRGGELTLEGADDQEAHGSVPFLLV